MVITMHGEEELMVHFSDPEMQPIEGSSKKHRWQVRTLATGAWRTENKGDGTRWSFKHTQDQLSPLFPDPGLTYPSPWQSPPWSAHGQAHRPSLWNFRGEEQLPWSSPQPHLPGITLLDLRRQNGLDRQSEQKLLWVQRCTPV